MTEEETQGIREQMEEMEENQEIYEGLTEERLREVVDEVLAEGHEPHDEGIDEVQEYPSHMREETEEEPQPRAIRIDVADIPPGMTPEQVVQHYQTTGSYTITTGDSTTAATTWVDSGTTNTEIPIPLTPEELLDKVEEEISLTPEEIVELKAIRKEQHRLSLKIKRENCVKDLEIDSNDLIIVPSGSRHYRFYHIDLQGRHDVGNSKLLSSSERRRSKVSHAISGYFFFDKHMNRLIPNADGLTVNGKIKTVRTGQRIYGTQINPWNGPGAGDERKFVIINKDAFINSKGRSIILKRKQDIPYQRIKDMKSNFSALFDKIDQFLAWMKTHINEVHPQEDYDIMYTMGGSMDATNYALLLKFRDITVQNSLEMNHHIGDIFIRSAGQHVLSSDDDRIRCSLSGSIHGARIKFTPADAALSYQHSHLTSSMNNFGSFCTGGENYNHGSSWMTPMELQAHIMRLYSFIQWESLEGGPHMKMENINIHGQIVRIMPSVMEMNREVTSSYVRGLVSVINKTRQKFAAFSDCFSLINDDGNLKFVADYERFYEKFISIIGNDAIQSLNRIHGEKAYTYNSVGRTFHKVVNSDMTDSRKIIDKARANMQGLTPIYMNRKYHRPRLTTLNTDDILQGVRFCPEPNFMREVAQMILYKLTDKLEKYGNTSESKGEEGRVSAL